MSENSKPHLFVKNVHTSQSFTTPQTGGGGTINLPERDRNEHGNSILSSLTEIWRNYEQQIALRNNFYKCHR